MSTPEILEARRLRRRAVQKLRLQTTIPSYFEKKLATIRKNNAPRSKVGCDLLVPQLVALWNSQGGRCALTGAEMTTDGRWPNTCSVDREEPGGPYTIGNVRLITWQANAARGNGTDAELIRFARNVLREHLKAIGRGDPSHGETE